MGDRKSKKDRSKNDRQKANKVEKQKEEQKNKQQYYQNKDNERIISKGSNSAGNGSGNTDQNRMFNEGLPLFVTKNILDLL